MIEIIKLLKQLRLTGSEITESEVNRRKFQRAFLKTNEVKYIKLEAMELATIKRLMAAYNATEFELVYLLLPSIDSRADWQEICNVYPFVLYNNGLIEQLNRLLEHPSFIVNANYHQFKAYEKIIKE